MEPVGGGATGARTRLRNQMRRLFRLLPFSTASTSRAAGEVKRFMDGDIEENSGGHPARRSRSHFQAGIIANDAQAAQSSKRVFMYSRERGA